MHKKFMLACMAIAAFAAFVIAPAASATTLTDEGPLAVGASVEAHSTGNVLFETSAGTVTCTTATLKGTVTQNNSIGPVKGEIPADTPTYTGLGTGGACLTSIFGSNTNVDVTVNSKLCLEAGANDVLKVTGCGGVITFTLTFTGVVTCKYEAASISGTYTTNSTPATGSIVKQPATGESSNPFLCPAKGELTQDFDLYTTGRTIGLTLS